MSLTIKLSKKSEDDHSEDCVCQKNLIYSYKMNESKWIDIRESEEVEIKNVDGIIEIGAHLPNIEGDNDQIFCFNDLNDNAYKFLIPKWIDETIDGKNRRWKLLFKEIPEDSITISLKLLSGYKTSIVIKYEEPSDGRLTHLLCKKENGKTLHALGPRDEDINKKERANERKKVLDHYYAYFELNETEVIHAVGVEKSNMKNSHLIIESENSNLKLNMKQNNYIWDLTLLKADNRAECIPSKKRKSHYDDELKSNVTMGVDET